MARARILLYLHHFFWNAWHDSFRNSNVFQIRTYYMLTTKYFWGIFAYFKFLAFKWTLNVLRSFFKPFFNQFLKLSELFNIHRLWIHFLKRAFKIQLYILLILILWFITLNSFLFIEKTRKQFNTTYSLCYTKMNTADYQ